jgi:hypothetical protein
MALHNFDSSTIRKELSDEVVVLAREFLFRITRNARSGDNVSPLLLYWAYKAASIDALLCLETGDDKHLQSWRVLEETLRTLSKRWMVAGKIIENDCHSTTNWLTGAYLQILEARNAI